MITDELKELVRQEADNLKKYATAEEIKRLDFTSLDGSNTKKCIYGQMTGNCNSERALSLLNSCAAPFTDLLQYPDGGTWDKVFTDSIIRSFSPIETYIYQWDSQKKSLVEYIRGETQTLEL